MAVKDGRVERKGRCEKEGDHRGDRLVRSLDCRGRRLKRKGAVHVHHISVSFLVLIVSYSYIRCKPGGKLREECTGNSSRPILISKYFLMK